MSTQSQARTANTLIAFLLVGIIFLLPLYVSVVVTVWWIDTTFFDANQYGMYLKDYLESAFSQDMEQLEKAFDKYNDWYEYWKQLDLSSTEPLQTFEPNFTPMDLTWQLFLGPTLSVLSSIFVFFIFRAPLTDFDFVKPKETIHGSARWANESDIRKAKLRAKKGLLLGRTGKSHYLVADDFQHVLLFAPTGSGKGVGFVIPNLLFWQNSAVVHDIKLENYELTSGWRKSQGQEVFVWNPADPDGVTHCYNPLDWVSSKPGQMVDDCQKICNLILPEQEFWQNEARSLLLGVILYLLAVPEKTNSFGEVVRTMRSDDVTYNLAVVLDTLGKKIHPVSYMNIAAFLQKADKERSGVVSTMNSGLELWANPLIDTATASSDFDLQKLKKKRMTVYCGVTPDNLQRLKPLLQVFYQQATDFLTRKMPGPDEIYGVLFMMDEFPTLGEMPQFQSGIAYFRGYKVKLFLIVQDTQQLKGIYEDAGMNSFLSNSYYRITFSANNVETANLISQLIGNKTVEQISHNKPTMFSLDTKSRTKSISEASRALLLPQEVITLPRDEQIILIESSPPIRTKKIFYFRDKFFTKRLLKQTFVPTQEPYDPRKKFGAPAQQNQPAKNAANPAGKAAPPAKPNAASPPPAAAKPAAPLPPAAASNAPPPATARPPAPPPPPGAKAAPVPPKPPAPPPPPPRPPAPPAPPPPPGAKPQGSRDASGNSGNQES